ncbi:MAG: Helix-turn-helix domain [Bacteroidetes bacterium]|nr:Helix-turn-helix domain [Bacteroidota bacterium]
MKEYLAQMGAKIKSARNAKGLYLRDLGAICKLDFRNICQLENGKQDVKLSTLKRLADALGKDVKDFL